MNAIKHKSYFLNKLKDKIKNTETTILTTVSIQGKLRSRPVLMIEMDKSGALWFFTNEFAGNDSEIAKNPLVCVSYSNSKLRKYVSITGQAILVKNQNKIQELWNPSVKKWFPEGLSDPLLVLIKINVETAEYWSSLFKTMLIIPQSTEAITPKENKKSKTILNPLLNFLNRKP